MDWTIELKGSGLERPMVFSYRQLAGMKMTRLENVHMRMTHAPDQTTAWEGPPLDALFAEARIRPGPMTLILEESGGYGKECTLAQAKSAIVAIKDGEGRWLVDLDAQRPLRLILPEMPANYWIRNLALVVVEPAAHAGESK